MKYLLYVFGWLLSFLPLRLLELIARGLTLVIFDLFRIRRKVILNNLDIAFKEEYSRREKITIARKSVENFILTILEFLVSVRIKIDENIEFKGKDKLDAILARDGGVYILCSHLGNWEAMGAAYSNNFVPSYILVKKVGKGSMADFVTELRDKNNFKMVKRKKKGDGFVAIKEAISKGEAIGFVFDQSRPSEPRLPFFGVDAKTNTSLAAIWQKKEAPIVASFIERVSFGKHIIHIFDELEVIATEDKAKDIIDHSINYNLEVEKMVRMAPEQYFWMHKRWK